MKTLFALLIATVLLNSGCGPSEPPAKGSDTGAARYMAQEFIKDTLKSPSSAEFSDSSETRVRYDSADDSYYVSGWVDAQNSFGAKLRSRYVCTVRNTGGETWKSRNCTLLE